MGWAEAGNEFGLDSKRIIGTGKRALKNGLDCKRTGACYRNWIRGGLGMKLARGRSGLEVGWKWIGRGLIVNRIRLTGWKWMEREMRVDWYWSWNGIEAD